MRLEALNGAAEDVVVVDERLRVLVGDVVPIELGRAIDLLRHADPRRLYVFMEACKWSELRKWTADGSDRFLPPNGIAPALHRLRSSERCIVLIPVMGDDGHLSFLTRKGLGAVRSFVLTLALAAASSMATEQRGINAA